MPCQRFVDCMTRGEEGHSRLKMIGVPCCWLVCYNSCGFSPMGDDQRLVMIAA